MAQFYEKNEELTVFDSCLYFITPNANVLEFGSATGYNTRYMAEKLNCTVTCIERSTEMAEMGMKYAEKMIVADVETYAWEKELTEKYDLIVFADILEHLSNPANIIKRVLPFLKEDGYIITSIPNIAHNSILMELRNGTFKYNETGLLDNTHIHFFTRKDIDDMFEENNLYCVAEENKKIRPCDTEFHTYYIQNPLFALSLINNKDGHVYRYVQKWSKNESDKKTFSGKMNCWQKSGELMYDFGCYFKRKFNLSTPKIVTNYVQKPLESADKKRYEKYNS
jgi:O-antigen biosynthesis protein